MKTLDWVKHYKQMNLITNVTQRFTMSPNLVVELKCTAFKAFITTKIYYFFKYDETII